MLFAIELNEQAGLMATLLGILGSVGAFLIWVFKVALPNMLNAYRSDSKEQAAKFEMAIGSLSAKYESSIDKLHAKCDAESERERQYFAKEMVTRDATFTTNMERLVSAIDKLSGRIQSVEMITQGYGHRIPLQTTKVDGLEPVATKSNIL